MARTHHTIFVEETMSNKNMTVKILLRNDTLTAWEASSLVLGKGEPAVVYIPDAVSANYQVKLKFGDGVHTFSQLKYFGLQLEDIPMASEAANGLMSKEDFAKVAALGALASKDEIAYDDLAAALKTLIDGKASTADMNAKIGDLGEKSVKAYVDDKVADVVAGSIDGLGALASKDKVAAGDLETSLKTQIDTATSDIATLKGAADVAGSVAEAKKAGDDAQVDVDALAGKVGAVTEGKTVVQMIDEAKTAATYDDTALAGRMSTLEGSDAGKSARAIAAEETAKIVAGADAAYDTLKEVSDWISSHKTDAAAMNSAILALEAVLAGIGGEGEKPTVVAYVADAIAALKIGDYAKAADLTALAARVTAAEGKLDTLTGADTAAGSVAKALKDAKAYTDEKDTAMGARVTALEGKSTNVAASETNGNIKVDGQEVTVYTLPDTVVTTADTLILDGGNAVA